MNKLLDESIESFLLLRQREERGMNNNSKEKSSKNSESSQNRERPVSFLEYIDWNKNIILYLKKNNNIIWIILLFSSIYKT